MPFRASSGRTGGHLCGRPNLSGIWQRRARLVWRRGVSGWRGRRRTGCGGANGRGVFVPLGMWRLGMRLRAFSKVTPLPQRSQLQSCNGVSPAGGGRLFCATVVMQECGGKPRILGFCSFQRCWGWLRGAARTLRHSAKSHTCEKPPERPFPTEETCTLTPSSQPQARR